ncbi:hypothetical protein C8F04DRAFT_1127997 [Mycena alexandri]|uniref:Uncharacterized protein n=1 Tax=Mycena alexandri TaxID=1745969 RepID=A0AAD6SDD3_9AGAR|nr:hypothetical protein C8F04DRAFT_1127997 [Mycena alexandri]
MSRAWIYLTVLPVALGSVNFDTCLAQVRNGDWGLTGGTDNQGRPVSNISLATAITYDLCVVACGSGSEPFVWNIFSQQFSAWLVSAETLMFRVVWPREKTQIRASEQR